MKKKKAKAKAKPMTGTPKGKNRTLLFAGIAIGVVSLAGLGYWYYSREQAPATSPEQIPPPLEPPAPAALPPVSVPAYPPLNLNKQFPLKRGSRGAQVKALQNALIQSYGSGILPRYGADGQFGAELEAALIKKGFSKVVSENDFKTITGAALPPGAIPNPVVPASTSNSPAVVLVLTKSQNETIAKALWKAGQDRNLLAVLKTLQQIRNTTDYSSVNAVFKTLRYSGLRQTIVNALLSTFSDETSKNLIRMELNRMGLKFADGKWSLSGLSARLIRTIRPSQVRSLYNIHRRVPGNTLLGVEVQSGNGLTVFRAPTNELHTIPTKDIDYV